MTDRADEIARKIVRENTDDVEEYAELEFAITATLRMCGLPEHRGIEHTSLSSMRIAPCEIIPMIQTDSLAIERVVDRRAADDRIRHLEAQVAALRALIAELERKLGERPSVEGNNAAL